MSWKLRMDVVIEAAFDALSDDVREQLAMAGVGAGIGALGTVRVVQIDH
ncbi:hypothetical protein K4749_17540 [Streptomyces sp. TRM72054]|nr:hypothetical protein [Streptomyces sp. TRM72054]MBX9395350.1 hypothetical protein [Streptomyces sp. TRM72054]